MLQSSVSTSRAIPTVAEIMDDRARTLADLVVILEEVGSEHALVGGLAVGFHGRAATIDVDLLVPLGKLAGLSRALGARG